MKGINSIKRTSAKGLITLTMFLVSTVVFAVSPRQYCFSCSGQPLKKDRLAQQHHPFVLSGSSKKSVLKFAAFRTKKSNILAETDLVVSQIESHQPVIVIEPKEAFYDSLYSLPVIYHFTSRGPPSA